MTKTIIEINYLADVRAHKVAIETQWEFFRLANFARRRF